MGTPDTLRTYTPCLQNPSVLQLFRENTLPANALDWTGEQHVKSAGSHIWRSQISLGSSLQIQSPICSYKTLWMGRPATGYCVYVWAWGRGQGRELGRRGNHTRDFHHLLMLEPTGMQNHSKKEFANYKMQVPYPLEILISRSGVGPKYIYLFSR